MELVALTAAGLVIVALGVGWIWERFDRKMNAELIAILKRQVNAGENYSKAARNLIAAQDRQLGNLEAGNAALKDYIDFLERQMGTPVEDKLSTRIERLRASE